MGLNSPVKLCWIAEGEGDSALLGHPRGRVGLLGWNARPPASTRAGMSHINDPKHWRHRAEEARAMAESLTDPEAKQLMLNVAADYEKLAKRAEDRSTGMKLP